MCRKCSRPTCERFQSAQYLKKEMCGKCGWEDHPSYMTKCSNPKCKSGLTVAENFRKPELCSHCGILARSQRK